jgi:hypothetical protein
MTFPEERYHVARGYYLLSDTVTSLVVCLVLRYFTFWVMVTYSSPPNSYSTYVYIILKGKALCILLCVCIIFNTRADERRLGMNMSHFQPIIEFRSQYMYKKASRHDSRADWILNAF